MLQKLRDTTSGWIATVILGLLIIPFAFFGMESYMSQRVDSYAARIAQPPVMVAVGAAGVATELLLAHA